ncbi:hypothetical protein ACFLYW_04375, partial [Thermodesulfobacteriota bacterium]
MKLVQQFFDHFYLSVQGTNLFDEEYETYLGSWTTDYFAFENILTGYPGAGRTIFGKLEYRY